MLTLTQQQLKSELAVHDEQDIKLFIKCIGDYEV